MMLFHGSNCIVNRPRIDLSRTNLDFGKGFYATSHQHQAESWAKRKAMRTGKRPIVNRYELVDDWEALRIARFPENDSEWVQFVRACRRGEKGYALYDLIIGGVADDQVFRAVDMYYRGSWDIETTLEALTFYERNDQYCFVSQVAVDKHLRFIDSYEVAL